MAGSVVSRCRIPRGRKGDGDIGRAGFAERGLVDVLDPAVPVVTTTLSCATTSWPLVLCVQPTDERGKVLASRRPGGFGHVAETGEGKRGPANTIMLSRCSRAVRC